MNKTIMAMEKDYNAKCELVMDVISELTGISVKGLTVNQDTGRVDIFFSNYRQNRDNRCITPAVKRYLKNEEVKSIVVHWHYDQGGYCCECFKDEIKIGPED